jgi:hypothetical protein
MFSRLLSPEKCEFFDIAECWRGRRGWKKKKMLEKGKGGRKVICWRQTSARLKDWGEGTYLPEGCPNHRRHL